MELTEEEPTQQVPLLRKGQWKLHNQLKNVQEPPLLPPERSNDGHLQPTLTSSTC